MKAIKTTIGYGVLAWLLPFIFSVIIFFLHTSERALFESLMTVFGVFIAILLTTLFFKKNDRNLRSGIFLGVIWVLISFSFDFLFFVMGPARMSFVDYVKDIGVSYLAIPIITIGFSYLNGKKEDNL